MSCRTDILLFLISGWSVAWLKTAISSFTGFPFCWILSKSHASSPRSCSMSHWRWRHSLKTTLQTMVQLRGVMVIVIGFRLAFHVSLLTFFWEKIYHGEADLFSEPDKNLLETTSREGRQQTSTEVEGNDFSLDEINRAWFREIKCKSIIIFSPTPKNTYRL